MQQDLRERSSPVRESPGGAIGEAPIAGRDWTSWLRALSICTAGGVFFAVIGAFEGESTPLIWRLAFWLPAMLGAGLIGGGVLSALSASRHLDVQPWRYWLIGTIAVSVPVTAWIWAVLSVFAGHPKPFSFAPVLFFDVAIVSAVMMAIITLANRPGAITHAATNAAPVPFFERMPGKLRGADLYAVQAEDHYLRIHTSKGSDLILLRLSDALSELEGIEGAQTHRSWWVARAAIVETKRDGDKLTLILKGGVAAPVSRPNIRPLRAAGWF